MTRQDNSTVIDTIVEKIAAEGLEGMAEAMRILLNVAMAAERQEFLRAGAHERTPDRRGYANGFKPKSVLTRIGPLDLRIPQVRDVVDGAAFYPKALERGTRSERALKLALAEMYVQGVSTRKVSAVLEQLCGTQVSTAQVSKAAALLDPEIAAWRTRPLGRCVYLLLDARYEKMRHGGVVVSCGVLTAVGIDENGRRSVLGVSVALSEAEPHWRAFLASLQERGLHGLQMISSDDHEGLKAARVAVFPSVPWQRCQCHLQRNAVAYVPRLEMRRDVAADLRGVFLAPTREEADRQLGLAVEKYRTTAPRLATWMETAVPEGLTVFLAPRAHRRQLRTTNLLEALNKELKRRTRVASLFPNENALLRLVGALLIETDEAWTTERRYLPKETD